MKYKVLPDFITSHHRARSLYVFLRSQENSLPSEMLSILETLQRYMFQYYTIGEIEEMISTTKMKGV